MKRVLLVAYGFPPRGGSGVQRALKLARYLGDSGWRTSVLTVKDPPSAQLNPAPLDELPDDVQIVRAWSLEPTRFLQALRRLVRRSGPRGGGVTAGYSGRSPRFIRVVQAFFIPDEKRFWSWWAVPKGVAHARAEHVDAVISTGPPQTAHLVASRIARRVGVPHVVDLRDPWVGNHIFVPPTPVHAWLQSRLERLVFSRAAAIVTTAPTVARDVSERYPALLRVLTITNGFDPADLPASVPADVDRFVMCYAGTFSGPRQPDALLAGLAIAERQREGLAEDTEVKFVGSGRETAIAADAAGVTSTVVVPGHVPHKNALREVAASDVALLIMSAGWESRQSVPGKLFEYLGLRRPVLALVGPGDVAELLADVQGVRIVDPEDPEAIGAAIVELFDAWREGGLLAPRPEDAAPYSRVEIARRYAALLDEVVSTGA